MRFLQLDLDLCKLDIHGMTAWYTRRIRELFRHGLADAIAGAETLVPVLTGRAKGAYLKVVRSLRLNTTLDFTVTSKHVDKLKYLDYDMWTGAAETHVFLGQDAYTYIFELDIGVPYFGRWDKPRWKSLDFIRESMENYFDDFAETYVPVVEDRYFLSTRIKG